MECLSTALWFLYFLYFPGENGKIQTELDVRTLLLDEGKRELFQNIWLRSDHINTIYQDDISILYWRLVLVLLKIKMKNRIVLTLAQVYNFQHFI